MKKFLGVIISAGTAVLFGIIGILGCVAMQDVPEGAKLLFVLVPVVSIVGGFGGAIIFGLNTLKSFFTTKTIDKK